MGEEESGGENRIKELELKLKDAEITNRAKDMHIQRQNEEREMFFERLNEASHQIGVLEPSFCNLKAPDKTRPTRMTVRLAPKWGIQTCLNQTSISKKRQTRISIRR